MKVAKIKDIDFGQDDGATEVKRSAKINQMFFDDDNYIEKLTKGTVEIIQGRKGSGKSILANFFAKKATEEGNSARVKPMLLLKKKKLALLGERIISEEEANIFWQYVLMDLLIDQYKKDFNLKDSQIKTLSSAQDSIKVVLSEITTNTTAGGEAEAGFKAGIFGGKISGKGSKSTVKHQESKKIDYVDNFELLYTSFFNQIKREKKKVYLIIDDLDELAAGLQYSQFIRLSLKFIEAIHELNTQFEDDGIRARIVGTLRSDLVEAMNKTANNLAKIMNDSSIKLTWITPAKMDQPWNLAISKMILTKARASNQALKGLSLQAQYRKFFSFDEQQSQSTQVNAHMNFIMRSGFGRPRDVFMLLKEYQTLYPDDYGVDYKQLISIQKRYSHKFYSELQNEMNLNEEKDNLYRLIEETIVSLGQKNFYLSELFDVWKVDAVTDDEKYFRGLIKELYIYGILGIRKGKGVLFSHFEGAPLPKEFPLTTKMTVHNAIANHLSIL